MQHNNLTGKKFGRLTVLKESGRDKQKRITWLCECICGNTNIIRGYILIRGETRSCGCLAKEIASRNHTTHGMSKTRFYTIWVDMTMRCRNKNDMSYSRYGGRSIKCSWNSFEEFKCDMFSSYKKAVKVLGEKNTTIDRIDNNKGYFTKNCRWSSYKEQNRNRRNNFIITFKGDSFPAVQWSEITKIKSPTIIMRIKRGWSAEEALTTPV